MRAILILEWLFCFLWDVHPEKGAYLMKSTGIVSKTRRGRIGKGRANTLDTNCNQATIDPKTLKLRKLTPKDCFRLQGFPDEYFDRAQEVNLDSQLYKQAGNSLLIKNRQRLKSSMILMRTRDKMQPPFLQLGVVGRGVNTKHPINVLNITEEVCKKK